MIKRLTFSICFFLACACANGQNYFNVIVKDCSDSTPLTGATIIETGTNNGAFTDANGFAKIAVTKTGSVSFSIQLIGYNTKSIDAIIPTTDTALIYLTVSGEELGEVNVTSVRTNSRIDDIPTRVEVLGLDELVNENGVKPGNLMSLLGDIAGIQMQQVSASSGNTYARIQGLNGRYTQLLKDGMPLFGGMSGSFGILQIPPLDLKQIEIIKGSVSTLYGGDAIGGIINLISKDPPEKRELSLTLNHSSLKESNYNFYYGKKNEVVGYTLFLGYTDQIHGDVDNDGLSDVPDVKSVLIHPKLQFYLSKKSTLTLNYTGTFDTRKGGERHYFKSESDSFYHVKNKITRHNSDLKYLYVVNDSSNFSIKASNSLLDQGIGTNHFQFNARQFIYYSEASYYKRRNNMEWVGGINFNGNIFKNKSPLISLSDNNYTTLGAFLQNTWKATRTFTVESGFREDYHSRYGAFALPRLSFMNKFSKYVTARLNGGFGYKIPDVITYLDPETDLNGILSYPALKAELSKGINADVNYSRLIANKFGLTFNQSFFYTDLSKPVYNSSSNSDTVRLVNGNKSIITKGVQTYARITYASMELYLGYVYTDVKKMYDSVNTTIPVTPVHNFSSTFFYEWRKWKAGIESSFIAGQKDENYRPVKSYAFFAFMIQYSIENASIVLNGENIFDIRQSKYGRIYEGSVHDPVFHKLWAPVDGRVINLSLTVRF